MEITFLHDLLRKKALVRVTGPHASFEGRLVSYHDDGSGVTIERAPAPGIPESARRICLPGDFAIREIEEPVSKLHKLPAYVYLVTSAREWPVTAVTDCGAGTEQALRDEIDRRSMSGNVVSPEDIKVWRVPVTEAAEVEVEPPRVLPARIRLRAADQAGPELLPPFGNPE